jgi:hypothetical protein
MTCRTLTTLAIVATLGAGGCSAILDIDQYALQEAPEALEGALPDAAAGSGSTPEVPAPHAQQPSADSGSAEPLSPRPPGEPRDAAADDVATGSLVDVILARALASDISWQRTGSESDCLNGAVHYEKKEPRLTVFHGPTRYGEAEWMESTIGACNDHQWIRFDIDVAIPGPLELRYITEHGEVTDIGYSWPDGLGVGRFEAPILSDDRVICGLLSIPGQPRENWPVFGNHEDQTPRATNQLPGTMC